MLHRAPAPPRGPAGFPELCARTPKPTPPPCAGKAPPVRPPGEHRAWPSWGLRVTQFPRRLAKGLGHCGTRQDPLSEGTDGRACPVPPKVAAAPLTLPREKTRPSAYSGDTRWAPAAGQGRQRSHSHSLSTHRRCQARSCAFYVLAHLLFTTIL